jgi:hypothetical protein
VLEWNGMELDEMRREGYPSLYPAQNRGNMQVALLRERSMPFPNAQRSANLKFSERGVLSEGTRCKIHLQN